MLLLSNDCWRRMVHWLKKSSSFSKIPLLFKLKHSCIAPRAISLWVQSLWFPFSYTISLNFSNAWVVSFPYTTSGWSAGFSDNSKVTMLTFYCFGCCWISWSWEPCASYNFSQRDSFTLSGKSNRSSIVIKPVFC